MKFFNGTTHKYRYLFKNVWGGFSRYLKDLIKCSKRGFMGYQEYKNKVAFLDEFYFQQNTRKQSIRNLKPVFYLGKRDNKWILAGLLIALCIITPFTNWAIPYILIRTKKGGFLKWNKNF